MRLWSRCVRVCRSPNCRHENRLAGLLPGPKHGIARGVAVFGSSDGGDCASLAENFPTCERLHAWAAEHDLDLSGEPDSLRVLDQAVDAWTAETVLGSRLGVEVGL